MSKVKSIRGESVDFDLLEVKEQIANTPKTDNVNARERFVDKKRRRSTSRSVSDLVAEQSKNEASVRDALNKQKETDTSTTTTTQATGDIAATGNS